MLKREPTTESYEIAVRPMGALLIDDDDGFSDGSREASSVRSGGVDGWLRLLCRSVFGPSLTNLTLLTLAACQLLPAMLVDAVLYPLFRLIFGTLYPAYASYKAVRSKDVKEYVKWMMYWIVFALFTSAETFTDVFLGFWFPFYYEVKVILVFWLLSPMTKGSSFLYRKFVHPMLSKREQDIDEYIARAKDQGYSTVVSLGTKGVNYATAVIMQTAIKGGGGLVNQLRRSYSLSDISMDIDEMSRVQTRINGDQDRTDSAGNGENRTQRQRAYSSRTGVEMYFPEVDVDVRQRGTREVSVPLSQIRSTEDVSSGYSSAEPLYARAPTEDARESLVRTSSVGSARVTRTRTTRAAASPGVKTRAAPTEDSISFDECEESDPEDMDEEFFEVTTSSSPAINIKPITYTVTMHQATLTTPAEVGKSVRAEKTLTPMLQSFSESLLEMYLDNIGDKGDDQGIEVVELGVKAGEKKDGNLVSKLEENSPNPVEIKLLEENISKVLDTAKTKSDEKTDNAVVKIVEQEIKIGEQNVIENKPMDNKSNIKELITVATVTTEANNKTAKPILAETPETEPDNFEDADFFDTASIGPSIETLAENKQTVGNAKPDRAGKYHKRPAPGPPRKADGDSLSPDGDDVSFKSADSRGSPSPRRDITSCDPPLSADSCGSPSPRRDITSCDPPLSADSRGSPSPRRDITSCDPPNSILDTQNRVDEIGSSKLLTPAGPSSRVATINQPPVAKPKAEPPPSPNQQKKVKESPMSRLLSKFFSHESASRGLVATSLTNLTDEIEAELRSASSLTFLGPDKPPKLPPKPSKKDGKREEKDMSPSGFRIRDMSHSPPRRMSDI